MYRRKFRRVSCLALIFVLVGFVLVFPISAYAFGLHMDLANADASFIGEDWGWSGNSVASAGDVNNDGYDDFLIGAPLIMSGFSGGETYLILGKDPANWGNDVNLANADASFIDEATKPWGWSGWSVASAGDVNNDGYDDFLIGAPRDSEGGDTAGQTYLILGKDPPDWGNDFDLGNADASFIGERDDAYSGRSVASAGDVNNDGYDDFLIGAHKDTEGGTDAGQTYLILGKETTGWAMDTSLSAANASFIGEDADDLSGFSVASAGDVNHDGYDDFLVGASGDEEGGPDAGQTYLILGKDTADWGNDFDLRDADKFFRGEDEEDSSGNSVACAGDVNGDGYDDFLIGAFADEEGESSAGQTYLILGEAAADWGNDFDLGNADTSFIGEHADDVSGTSVASAGDTDGDGYGDFLIGAPSGSEGGSGAGQTYLILGKATADWGNDVNLGNANASFIGERDTALSGWSVASAGDVNRDGYGDFLVGAVGDSEGGGLSYGQTYLILGEAPPPPPAVGGEAYSINRANVLAPWLGLAAAVIAGGILLVRRRVHS